jgi:hypothetical protein
MTRLPLLAKLAVFYTIELCWNPWVGVAEGEPAMKC